MTEPEADSRRARHLRQQQRFRRAVLVSGTGALVLIVILVSLFAIGGGPAHRRGTPVRHEGHTPAPPSTFSGPDGIEATWVVQENARPGTTAWQIPSGKLGGIEGYLSAVQASEGQQISLFVSTNAPSWTVTAFRMGYYGGDGARQVWTSPSEPGSQQPPCPLSSGVNMVECSWTPSLHVTIDSSWVQGDYLLKLEGSGGQQSYVPLTVWDPASHATYLVQNSVLTWQAWNTYGGYDFYGGGTPGGSASFANRARVVSFDRPYATGEGAADFLGEEYPLVRFVEQHGLDVTYGTDITTAEDPTGLLQHRAFFSLGHDEQWSLEMRNAATAALAHGVNLAFFGASPVLRKVRLQPSPLGPDRQEVNYRDPSQDPELQTNPSEVSQNTWDQAPASWPPSALVGSTYFGYGITAALVVTEPSSWLYTGTGLAAGAQVPGVIASDVNGYTPGNGEPAGVEILAHSPAKPAVGRAGYADTVYYTVSGGGGVFSSGTNGWIPAMAPCPASTPSASCAASAVQQMTGNLFAVFGTGPAGATQPSKANWQQYYA